MYFRTFFFILFIATATLFFVSSLQPILIENFLDVLGEDKKLIPYVRLTSMFASSISLILFLISSYYAKKNLLIAIKKLEAERRNIEQIHNELEALKK